jgi:lysophospholipase L1-like esterase
MSLSVRNEHPRGSFVKAACVVVLLVIGLVAVYLALRPRPAPEAGNIVGFTAPPSATSTLRVTILRGGSTGCTTTGGCNDANYAQVLSAKEGWITTVLAQGGTGYVSGSDKNPPSDFAARLTDVYKASPDLVIVEGSVSDQYYSGAAIQQAAVAVFTNLKSHLPNAKVVVVGPAWAGTAPAKIMAVEDAVKAACAGRVALFIDPIAEGWFSGANAALMGSDHESPTDQGHARMAAMIAADIASIPLQASTSSPLT